MADQDATLADLLQVWEPLADDPGIAKKYATENGFCKGCRNNCCNEAFVVPDLISFKAMCRLTGKTPQEFLDWACEPEWIKKGIPRLRSRPCLFLIDHKCTVYPVRSLICRFYLCSDIVGETEELIYSAVTAGMSATFCWLQEQGLLHQSTRGLTSYDRSLLELVESYRRSPAALQFLEASSYQDVALKHFITTVSP